MKKKVLVIVRKLKGQTEHHGDVKRGWDDMLTILLREFMHFVFEHGDERKELDRLKTEYCNTLINDADNFSKIHGRNMCLKMFTDELYGGKYDK